jgi:hypothetical protein
MSHDAFTPRGESVSPTKRGKRSLSKGDVNKPKRQTGNKGENRIERRQNLELLLKQILS